MSKLFCIDSMAFIWGIKKQASYGQENMIEKTEKFFEFLDREGVEILIPSVVLAEVLPVETKESQIDIFKKIQSRFRIGNFNANTAIIFADLFGNDAKAQKEFANSIHIPYNKLKIDYMIIATAIENRCQNIITHNPKDFKTYSNNRIGIIEVKDVHGQTEMQFE